MGLKSHIRGHDSRLLFEWDNFIPLPAADRDADRQYHVINGYPVVFSFSKEPNPEAFERIRNILLATSYTKKVG